MHKKLFLSPSLPAESSKETIAPNYVLHGTTKKLNLASKTHFWSETWVLLVFAANRSGTLLPWRLQRGLLRRMLNKTNDNGALQAVVDTVLNGLLKLAISASTNGHISAQNGWWCPSGAPLLLLGDWRDAVRGTASLVFREGCFDMRVSGELKGSAPLWPSMCYCVLWLDHLCLR